MGKGEQLWCKLMQSTDLPEEPMPGQPIVEIYGGNRILVENHLGVKGYGRAQITVKVKYGYIQISGSCLELTRMTRDQLIIHGNIDQVTLQRRC